MPSFTLENGMSTTRKLWIALAVLLVTSFSVLLWAGGEIFRAAPPVPEKVLAEDGAVIYTRADIETGRQVWQSIGGMQLGSIWGHGGYVAPDWSADWLHRESIEVLNLWARSDGGAATWAELPAEQQAALQGRLKLLMRTNTYDAEAGTITLSRDRTAALSNVAAHYESLFSNDPTTASLREAYAMKQNTVDTPEHRRALTAFFWWTAWAAGTERPVGRHRRRRRGQQGRVAQQAGHLHQQLALRAPGRQPTGADTLGLVGIQRAVPDRGHRPARLAPCRHPRTRRRRPRHSGDRSVRNAAHYSVHARHREIFLGGAGLVPQPDPAWRNHRALSGRRPDGLRLRTL
jgi:hypothetical protein